MNGHGLTNKLAAYIHSAHLHTFFFKVGWGAFTKYTFLCCKIFKVYVDFFIFFKGPNVPRSPLTAVLQRIILNGASKLWHWSATIRWMFYAWYSAIVDCGAGRNSVRWFAWPLIKLTAPIKVILFVALRTSAALNIHKNTTMKMSTFEIDACAYVRLHFSWVFSRVSRSVFLTRKG